uniref:LysM domain-containing protein n=1 Tax=Kalanchoe fedtschenkoi TaxID=63787 RepID=A0A7N0U295_KALFE
MMQMGRDMRGGGGGGFGNGNYVHYDHHHHNNNHAVDLSDVYDDDSPSSSLSKTVPGLTTASSSSPPVIALGNGLNYIEHHVSKMDTLAGVAIKYGVEVADIKKLNSLVTDLQMFALKTLQIPLPGRHPPSPCLSNNSESPGQCSYDRTPQSRAFPDLLDSFQSLKVNSSPQRNVSPAMNTLQVFYGLDSSGLRRNQSEGFEMATYRKENGPFPKQLLHTNPPLSRHRKSKSMANGFYSENGDLADGSELQNDDSDKWIDNLLRRGRTPGTRGSKTPEILLKEDPSSNSGGFSAVKGKGLALRSKAASRTCLVAEDEVNGINCTPTGSSGSSVVTDHLSGVRKSSSTPSLQDQETCSSSTWLTSKWNLKTDLQALSAAAIARPIFDGLPKPITGRKNKAALD